MKAYLEPAPPVNRRVASNTLTRQILRGDGHSGSARRQGRWLVGLGAAFGPGGRELDTGCVIVC